MRAVGFVERRGRELAAVEAVRNGVERDLGLRVVPVSDCRGRVIRAWARIRESVGQ